ncbi:hypothetical protein WJ64_08650 [Burkholderia ubonensis]|nr:hypothetical protein WJ64_08650 [Burkholderia ubonensis]
MAQHLVLDLNQVAGVEKIVRLEPGRLHPLGMGTQYAEAPEALQLWIGLGQDRCTGAKYVI